MRAFVFTDRALERQAGRVVWLSIDGEKEQNAGFLEKYPIAGYPTLLVIDPEREEAALRWVGGATAPQIAKLLDDGERALGSGASGADAALAEADRLMGAGKNELAAKAYRATLDQAPASWPRRDRTVESLLTTLGLTDASDECVAVARAELPAERSYHYAAVAAAGLGCALALEGQAKAEAVVEFERAAESAVGRPPIEMPADDRSGIYGLLVETRKDAGDSAGARAVAQRWLAFLDGEAERASTAEGRAVFDPHRLSAAIAAGVPEHAIPVLVQSEKDFPRDYNPPARLAVALLESGRYDEALAAADRALDRAFGPRKLRLYSTKADILLKRGDRAAAWATLEQALRHAKSLPKAQVAASTIASIEKRIAEMTP